MEQILVNYLANATWQIPLLVGAAWLFIRMGKFGPQMQHCIWLAVLGLAVGLPLRGVGTVPVPATQAACADCNTNASAIGDREALPRAAIVTQFVVAGPQFSKEFFTLPRPTLRLSPVATNWLVGLYFSILLYRVYRILMSWRGARRLVMDASPTALPSLWYELLEESGRRLVAKLPQVRKSADVFSPVIVGVTQPVLLLPDDFDNHTADEVQAALYHELAHVRRHDYLSNLLCQFAALPVSWHPLTYAVQQRIRRTREMVCDAIAAGAMQSEAGYAKCLLAMAGRNLAQHQLSDAAQAIGLFGDNVLEERIMRLMQQKTTMTMQARLARIAGGATAMLLAILMAATLHVAPTLAQSSGSKVTAPAAPPPPAPPKPPAAPNPSVAPAAPAEPAAPPAPDGSAVPAVPAAPAVPSASADGDTSASSTTPFAPLPPLAPIAPLPQVAPFAPLAALAPLAPLPQVEPMTPLAPVQPEPKPWVRKKKVDQPQPKVDADPHAVIEIDGDTPLTAEQKAKLQADLDAMNRQVAEATKRFNSPEFKQQMAEIAEQQANLHHIDFAKMQRQIDAATAKINSPEFKQQIAEATKRFNSPEFKQQMAEMARQQAKLQHMDFAKMQQQIDAATAKINSPEFKQQMADIQKRIESGEMQRSMEEAMKQLKAAEDQQTQHPQTK